jgi:hypothetical protein
VKEIHAYITVFIQAIADGPVQYAISKRTEMCIIMPPRVAMHVKTSNAVGTAAYEMIMQTVACVPDVDLFGHLVQTSLYIQPMYIRETRERSGSSFCHSSSHRSVSMGMTSDECSSITVCAVCWDT